MTSSRPQVLSVVSVLDGKLVVRGGAPGVAELTVTARDSAGKILTDTMFFHVAKPAVHRLEHACTEASSAAYVKGAPLDIHHALATADRRTVIGYDYAPITVEPKDALELVAQPQGSPIYRFVAKSANPRVTVRSEVDQRVLTLRVVDRADLDDVTLENTERMLVGQVAYAVAWVNLEGATLCSQDARTKARSLTPAICSVTAKLDDEPGEEENHAQLADITALAFGTCRFEVTLPDLAGGRGVTRTSSVAIGRAEFPGDGKTGEPQAPGTDGAPRVLGRDLHGWPYLAAWWLGSNALVLVGGVLGGRLARARRRRDSRSDSGDD